MTDEETKLPCADKISFDAKALAEGAAAAADWQHGTKLKAYRCKYCELWHLSSQTPD